MGLSAKYKRRAIRTKKGYWFKKNNKPSYCSINIYTSTSGKVVINFIGILSNYGNATKIRRTFKQKRRN